jgi:hypothetical protein
MTAKEFYALPTKNLRTYPVYVPDREPRGLLGDAAACRTEAADRADANQSEADWIAAGQRVFDELDHLALRTLDPKWIAAARSAGTFDSRTMILSTGEINVNGPFFAEFENEPRYERRLAHVGLPDRPS